MLLPDGSTLMHAKHAPYDPVKAHEYYMRNRKLHPRQKNVSYTVKKADGSTVRLSAKELSEQKAYAAHRVSQIRGRLVELNKKLRKKIAEAKVAEREAKKPDTAAEKREAAKSSEKYRDKHKQELKNKAKKASSESKSSGSKEPKSDTVTSLRADILIAKGNLKAAVAKQRSLATAKQNG